MTQLREFARHKKEFDEQRIQVVAVSVDDMQHVRQVWEKVTERNFTILSDPGAKVIRKYGLLHAGGAEGKDIGIRATIFIDEQGIERWRRVSETVPDIPSVNDVLQRIPPAK
jgi:peroxiredoxin